MPDGVHRAVDAFDPERRVARQGEEAQAPAHRLPVGLQQIQAHVHAHGHAIAHAQVRQAALFQLGQHAPVSPGAEVFDELRRPARKGVRRGRRIEPQVRRAGGERRPGPAVEGDVGERGLEEPGAGLLPIHRLTPPSSRRAPRP